jgi:hypothetical protein
MDLIEIGWSPMDWIETSQDRGKERAIVNMIINLLVP